MSTKLAFKKQKLQGDSILHKLFKTPRKSDAAIEINNLFSKKNITNVKTQEIVEIYDRYKINSPKKIISHLKQMYEQYLEHCLKDRELYDDEIKSLKELKKLFKLTDEDIKKIEQEAFKKVFGEAIEEFLKDDHISKEEKAKIEKIQKNLQLDKKIVEEIYGSKVKKIYQRYLDEAISDQKLSPDEEKQLQAIAENLGINVKTDEQTQKQLDKFRLFWNIENENIPTVPVSISLQKSETCYFSTEVKLHELRKVTRRINYGGPTFRVKIMKGVYYRTGSLGVQAVSEDVMTHIDSGQLFLTNKRILFMGSKKNANIRLNKILDFECFKNGVSIQKDTGKSPFYEFNDDVDLFAVILGKVLKDV